MNIPTATKEQVSEFALVIFELLDWLMGKEGKNLDASTAASILAGTFMLMFAGAPPKGREMLLGLARRIVEDCEKHKDETEVRDILTRARNK